MAIDWTDAPLFGQYRAVLTLPGVDGLPDATAATMVTVVNVPALMLIGIAGIVVLALVGALIFRRSRRRLGG